MTSLHLHPTQTEINGNFYGALIWGRRETAVLLCLMSDGLTDCQPFLFQMICIEMSGVGRQTEMVFKARDIDVDDQDDWKVSVIKIAPPVPAQGVSHIIISL